MFAPAHLPVALSEMLDKFHKVCRVRDDFKVEFLNWKNIYLIKNSTVKNTFNL